MSYGERIRPYGSTVSESLDGRLPSIDIIRQGLHDQVSDITHFGHRVVKLTHLTQQWREQAADRPQSIEPRLNQRDLLSELFLDCVDYSAWSSVLFHQKNQRPDGDKKVDLSHLLDNKMAARVLLRQRVWEYDAAFAGAPDQVLYNGLYAVTYDALCLVRNKDDIHSKSEITGLARRSLAGILSEHKALKSLRGGSFPQARYSTEHEDSYLRWDITVPPSEANGTEIKALQVKTHPCQPGTPLQTFTDRHGVIFAKVPSNVGEDFFSLSEADGQKLAAAVEGAPAATVPRMVELFSGLLAKSDS